jgi:hypothetical protein
VEEKIIISSKESSVFIAILRSKMIKIKKVRFLEEAEKVRQIKIHQSPLKTIWARLNLSLEVNQILIKSQDIGNE